MKKMGQSLVQLLLVIALASLTIPALTVGLVTSRSGKAQQIQRLQAVTHIREMQEAARSVRESGWDNFAINGSYHPQIVAGSWNLVVGSEVIDGFTRILEIEDVYRNEQGDITDGVGILDPSTKEITARVSWQTPYSSSVESIFYLTRQDNIVRTETTEADFNTGTNSSTTVSNTQGGEVILGGGGQGEWCNPNLSIQALDLPKNGVANAVTAIEGRAFAGTGDNASGESFVNINITNTDPPAASIIGTFSNYKTNDVFGETNYGYIATDTNSKEIVIINLSPAIYTEIGYFNASGNTDANSVFIVGNTGYMTQGNRLRNFNLATCSGGNRTGSCPAIDPDGAAISATGTAVVVAGNYAFVSIAGHVRELEIFNISNPANITRVGWADVNGEAARDVFINSIATRAYLVTDASSSLREFFIIDTTNKDCSDCTEVGSYDAGTSVNLKAVEVVPGNRAIVIGQGGEEYQVLDISNEASPVRCGGLNINSGINDSASILESDGDAYSYIVVGDASAEFRMIEGGPGQFTDSGTFESATFDTGEETTFNRFLSTISQPPQTGISIQMAVADSLSGSCDGVSFSFVGPDKTSNTFFTSEDNQTIEGPIPLDNDGSGFENPGQCFRYKAYLSTQDVSQTPILYDMTVNYAP